jgi:hypothetical protein
MHGMVLGESDPFVVQIACDSAGCGTIVIERVDRSPSGILNDTEAAALEVKVPGVLTWTTADPTKPHPRPELSAPLCRVTMVAVIPEGPLNVKPLVGFVRSTEFPHTSNRIAGPAITVRAFPDPAMCVVQLLVVVTYSTPAHARDAGNTASANTAPPNITSRRGVTPRNLPACLIMWTASCCSN